MVQRRRNQGEQAAVVVLSSTTRSGRVIFDLLRDHKKVIIHVPPNKMASVVGNVIERWSDGARVRSGNVVVFKATNATYANLHEERYTVIARQIDLIVNPNDPTRTCCLRVERNGPLDPNRVYLFFNCYNMEITF